MADGNVIDENNTHIHDLPLSANIKDVFVHHFILNWSCSLTGEKSIILFLSNVCCNSSNFMVNTVSQKSTPDHSSQSLLSNDQCTHMNENLPDCIVASSASVHCSHTSTERNSALPGSSCTLVQTESSEIINANDNGCVLQDNIKTSKECINTSSEKDTTALHFKAHEFITINGHCMNRTKLENSKEVPTYQNQSENTNIVEVWDASTKYFTELRQKIRNTKEREFVFTLDACDLDILAVEEVLLTDTESLKNPFTLSERKADIRNDQGFYMSHLDKPGQPLQFELQEHCVNISKQGVYCVREFPQVVRIKYHIRPEGKSFKWTKDIDNRDCGLTIGHWINNRSIFPSQDAPSAMPTWQAIIHAPKHLTILMSGDEDGRLIDRLSNKETSGYFFYTSMPMPTSTLAIAVGEWNCIVISENHQEKSLLASSCIRHGSDCQTNFSCHDVLPCRLFVPDSLKDAANSEMRSYLPLCLQTVKDVLGPHPFQRLDILVVPDCFDSLGMASPSLLFLSQSLLSGNFSMFPRVAHELCHSWFGLLIGPRDWTEEWLTEGFCTYLEDIIHGKVMKWSEKFTEEFIELRANLRYKTLYSEVQHTDETLQLLRPNQGENGGSDDKFVKNGMNPEKAFMQVHYLKGYFLLCYLEKQLGREKFLTFLKEYVARFHGELVSSEFMMLLICCFISWKKEFIGMFFECFPEIRHLGLSEESLSKEWLDYPGIPVSLTGFVDAANTNNRLITAVNEEVQKVSVFCERLTIASNKRRKMEFKVEDKELIADQLVLFLEQLLERKKIPEVVFTAVRERCSINENAEVSHRICELIVKHKYVKYYADIQIFLEKHQAMGVYLYGEMMLSSDWSLIALARKCFAKVRDEMPEGVYKTVHSMLYG